MELDRDDIEKIADVKITERFRNIGIYDQGDDAQEKTRSNFKFLNEMRVNSENRKVLVKRSIREIASSIGGQGLWALFVAGAVWLLSLYKGH